MRQHIARTLRYLAGWKISDQRPARTNAAQGSATLRERRHAWEDADAYLHAARLADHADEPETRRTKNRPDGAL
jgi:hypothetical protein